METSSTGYRAKDCVDKAKESYDACKDMANVSGISGGDNSNSYA